MIRRATHIDIPSLSAVAAIGTALGNEFFAMKTCQSFAAVAGDKFYFSIVDKQILSLGEKL